MHIGRVLVEKKGLQIFLGTQNPLKIWCFAPDFVPPTLNLHQRLCSGLRTASVIITAGQLPFAKLP